MLESFRSTLALLLDIGATRVELAFTELEEERLRLVDRLVTAFITLVLLSLTLVLLTVFVIVLMWDTHRLLTIGLLTLGFAGAGVVSALRWRKLQATRPPFLAATRAELQRDVAALRPAPSPGDAE